MNERSFAKGGVLRLTSIANVAANLPFCTSTCVEGNPATALSTRKSPVGDLSAQNDVGEFTSRGCNLSRDLGRGSHRLRTPPSRPQLRMMNHSSESFEHGCEPIAGFAGLG